MKKLFSAYTFMLLCYTLISCEQKDCCFFREGNNNLLSGTWLLYERGYSPGAGYVVEPVAASPSQTLTFQNNRKMSSTIDGLREYKFYFVQDNPEPELRILAFYKSDPGQSPEPSTFTTSYHFSFEGDNLKLYYRYCIEGCHLGLSKVE